MTMRSLLSCLFLVVGIITHSASFVPTNPPTPCDPLVPEVCTYPFPNDYWLVKDSNGKPTSLGFTEQNFPIANLPIPGATINPYNWNKLDGFSPIPAILAYFGDDLSIENCAPFWNIGMSLNNDAPIVLLDGTANDNTKLAYWVELDHSSDTEFTEEKNKSMMIWPSKRLTDGHTYIVAILDELKDNKGNKIQPSQAFVALRDNITTNNSAIEFRREYYNEYIFDILCNQNGIERSSLLLAWSFTVMTSKAQTNTMVTMRNDAFVRGIDKNGNIPYTIRSIQTNPYDNIARKVLGIIKVPWYLNQRLPGAKVRIVRNTTDWFGTPQFQELAEVEFEMLIPNSLANGSLPNTQTRYLQYGHGLFGSFGEIQSGYLRDEADEYGYILGGVDWLGLSSQDVAFVVEVITLNLTNFAMVPDRCHQGMLNALFLMKLWLSPDFMSDKSVFEFGNVNVLPSSPPYKRNYYGNSQGGILGTVYMALTNDLTHGTVGVPGGPYSLLLPRSADFTALYDDIKARYHSDTDRILAISLFQLLWNSLEPSGYISHINKNIFDNDTPMHSLLIHFSLGDAQVTWLGAQQIGREMGCYMYKSQVSEYNETLYGFDFVDDTFTVNTMDNGNAGKCLIQGWNYDEPQVPFVNKPPNSKYDTHEFTRRQPDSQAANYKFWSEGIIYNPCGGPCNGQPTNRKAELNQFKYSAASE